MKAYPHRVCAGCLYRLAIPLSNIEARLRYTHKPLLWYLRKQPFFQSKDVVAHRAAVKQQRRIESRLTRSVERMERSERKCAPKTREQIREEKAEYQRNKYKTDRQHMLRGRLRKRLRKTIGERKASRRTQDIIGCSFDHLERHIGSQFKRGMTWNNYGAWHIDHIVPCAAFDLRNELELKACFHFTNLRPMWAKDNIRKGKKIILCQPELCITY